MKVFWTKTVLHQLQGIEEYISQDNLAAAISFTDRLILRSETLSNNPEKGRIVTELSLDNIRELIHKNYRIVYLVKKNSIDILTLFEGHRLLKNEEIQKAVTAQGKIK